MATEADIPVPVCETRGEQVGNFVDNIINISVSKLSLDKQTKDDKLNEHPTVEGENFLRPPSTGQAHSDVNNVSPDASEVTEEPDQAVNDDTDTLLLSTKLDDQPVEVAVNEETPTEETESQAQCITEGEELNVQVKTTDNKSEDMKPTEEDMSCNLTVEVSKEGESYQNKMTSEQEVLPNERSVEDNSNSEAEKVSQESSTSTETITTLETSNIDELQSKSDSKSSFSKEEEMTVEKGDRSVTASEDYGDEECQPKNLEDAATDHSDPKLAEKPEESSFVQVEDSQIEHEEHLEKESERLPLTKVSMGDTNDNIPPATDNVKDKDEDLKELTNATLHGNTIEAEGATIDAVDRQKESLESCQPIVSSSSEEGSMNAVLQEVTSVHVEVLENLSIGEAHSEINNVAPDVSEVTEKLDQTVRDGTDTLLLSSKLDDQKVGFAANEETPVEEIQQNVEESNSTDKDDDRGVVPEQCSTDSSVVTSEMKVGDTLNDPDVDDARVVTQHSKDYTENIALTKELLEETNLPSEETESHPPCITEGKELNVQVKTTDNKSEDEKTTEEDMSCDLRSEVSKEGESDQSKMTSEHEALANERSVEDNSNTAAGEVSREDSTSTETITTLEISDSDELQSKSDSNSSFSKEEETTVEKGDRSVTASEDFGVPLENTLSESHGDEECQSKTLEDAATDHSYPKLAEKSEESSLVQTEDSQIERDEHLEEESERLPWTEVSMGDTNDNVQPDTDNVKDKDEDLKEAELSENEPSTRCLSVEEDRQIETPAESLLVTTENIDVSNLSRNTIEAEEATIDAVDRQKESLESFPPIVSSSLEEAVLQEVTSDHTDEKIINVVDKQTEVLENLSIGESHSETNNVAPDVSEVMEKPDQTVRDVNDKDEDHKESKLSENEPSTRCLSVEEDRQIETPAESLFVTTENIEVSNLSRNTIEAEEATIDPVDRQKESFESFPSIVSSSPEEAVLQEVTSDHTDEKIIDVVDKQTEVLENLSIGESHSETNNVAPDVSEVIEKPYQTVREGTDNLLLSPKLDYQKLEFAANEETSVEEIQQNVEESNSAETDGNGGVAREQCHTDSSVMTSEMKAGDTVDDPDMDDARVVTQLSKDISIDQHGTNDSFTENIALAKGILEKTDVPSEETGSHTPCITKGEELNVQVKTTDNKSEDEKTTEEHMSCDLTSEVSKEGESDQNKMTSEHEVLANERSVEDNSNSAAGEVSQEDSTSTETITTLETSNSDELQSKSDSNSSFSKEEEMTVEKGDRSVTAPEDYGVPLENTLNESHGEEECQSKTFENAATDHSDPKLAEKFEESSLVQIEDSQIERDEHLEGESERLPLTEVSTGAINDNVPPVTDIVKDKDEDLNEAELSENEPGTRCTSVKEDKQIETHAESLLVAHENIEVSSLSQENSIKGLSKEQSTDATLHGNIIEAEEATTDAVDQQKESLESFSPIVSSSPEEGVLQEVTSDHTDKKIIDVVDKQTEVLENLSIGEAHSEINNVAPDISEVSEKSDQTVRDGTDILLLSTKLDDQPVEFVANEETSVEEIQQNAEESNRVEKYGDRVVVAEQCSTDSSVVTSEMKVGDTLDDPDVDDARVVTQLSKDTHSDQQGTNDSFTENTALTKEILEEQETESQAPCITEGEVLNVQVKTTNDKKSEDEKPTEEDKSGNLTSEMSKEGESGQNKTISEHEVLANERSIEDNSNTEAEEVSQENSASTETITTLEISNSNELQSKSDFNSSFSKEDETTVQKGDRSLTTLEDYGVPLENTLSDSHGDIECQSKTLEDAATDHSNSKLAEKSEESSLDQIEDSQIECEMHLEVESERLPLTEASTGCTNDNVSEAMDKVKDEGEDLKEVELSENEQSTRCTLVKEDVQIEHPEESLHVEEQSTNANLHGNTIEAEEATINEVVDQQKESLESFPPIVSSSPEEGSMNTVLKEVTRDHTDNIIEEVGKHKEVLENLSTTLSTKDAEGNSLIKLDGSENQNEDDLGKESEKMPLPLPLAREVSDESKLLHEARFEDGESQKFEFCETERSTESMLLKTESRTENTEDSLHVTSEDNKAPDLSQEIETRSAIEEKDLSTHPQGILDKRSEGRIVDEVETKEDTLEQNVSNEDSDKDLLIEANASEMEHDTNLEEETERPSLTEASKEDPNDDESTILLEPKTADECLSKVELPNDEKSTDCTTQKKENLQDAPEDHKTSTSSEDKETTLSLEEQSLAENSQAIIGNTIIEAADKKELALENVATEIPHEHIEENSVTQVDCSEREHEERLEKDNQNSSLTEAIIEETNARDWKSRKTEEADVEKPVDSLQVKPEDIKQHDSSLDIHNSIEEQITDTDSREISRGNTEREPVDAADTNEESLEAKGIEKNNLDCDKDAANDEEESTKNTEGGLIKEEESIESLQVAAKNIETPLLGQDRGTSCLDEQSPIANTEGVMDDNKEDIADKANGSKDKTPKDKNIANTTLYEDKKENLQVQEDCSRLGQNEDLGNDSENTPFTEAPTVYTTESSPVKEEEQVKKPVEEQIIIADPQETCDKTQEKTVDAADEKDDVVVNVPNGDNEDNSPIEMDGSQKPSSEEASAEKINDDEPTAVHEANFANENTVKAILFEEEKKIESALAKEEVYIESLQVADEDIKATSSVLDREASHLEEQVPTTDSQGTSGDHRDAKTIHLADAKEEIVEDKNYATTPCKDTNEDPLIQVDGSLLEQKEHSEKDNESTSLTDAPKYDITESISVREVAQVEDPIDSSKVATEDIKAFASCQDTEISSTEKQILDLEDISSNRITEKTIEATGKETQEAQDIAKSVPHEEDSPNVEDGSQKPSLVEGSMGNIDEHESTTMHEVEFVDESLVKGDLLENEENTEATLMKEDVSIELPQVAAEDIKEPCLNEVRESADPGGFIDDNKDNITIDPIDFQKETPKDEVPNEIESVDVKATSIELKGEEGYLKDIQMTTAVNLVAAHQEKSSNLTAEKTRCAADLDANEDIIGHIPEVSNYKQQEPSITEVTEEHLTTSNERVSDNTSLESEVSEKTNDQVVGEATSCGDKTDSQKIEVPNDGSIAVPTNETPAETDPRGSTEAEVQVPNGEKDTELIIQEAEIDQKNVKETLLHNASEYVSESEEVNGEENTDSNNCNEISRSSNSVESQEVSTSNVALEEDSTSNSSQEPRRETREETETEEPQKQDSELQVSELIQDSSVENTERDAQPCLASANDSGITAEVQKLKEVPLPAPEENLIEITDCKESHVVEGATNNEDIDHLEQNDTTKSFSDDKKPTEEALQETVANDILPVALSETSGVDHSTTERELTNREEPCKEKTATGDDEKEACEEKISDISSAAPDMIEARDTDVAKLTNNSENIIDTTEGPMINENTSVKCILVNERSATDLETRNDDEAPEIKETTPSSAEGQDVESENVEENSNYPGSLTEVKSDSDEVAFAPGENKSRYESNNRVLESIAQVQSCDIISETEETKTEEENLEAEAEIKSDKAVAEDTLGQEETTCEKETLKDDISSEKEQLLRSEAEDEDIKDYDQGSCEEEVIRDTHQDDEVKQEQQKTSKETVEFIEDGSQTETVSKVSEEPEDKAPEDREEKILANEAIDRILRQEEQAKSIEEPTTKIDTVKAHELATASVKTDTGDSNKEGVKIAIIPGKESEQQNNKDEICSTDEVQAKDEENIMHSEGKSEEEAKEADTWTKPNEDEDKEAYVEAKKLDFASQTKGISESTVSDGAHIPKDDENSTTKNKFSEEDYPSKSAEVEVSSASKDIALTEQASEATIVTAEVQEAKAGIDLGAAALKATGIESREVEEVNDKCAAMEDTSTPVEPLVISTSKIIPECTVGTPLEAEDQQTKLHDLPEELNIKDSEVKMAEKDDVVNLQSVRDISENVQELSKESLEVSNNENPVEGDPEEKIETSEGQETKPVQNTPVSETLEQETEEEQLGRGTEDVHEEQKKINSIHNQLESTYGTESRIRQSSVEDTAQYDKREGSQQIDSPPSLPQAQCSDIKTSEKDLLVHVAGLDSVDVTELEASPLPLKDKHVVLEADDARNLNPENLGGNENISTEYSQGEREIQKPSKVEQEESECGNEERTDQEREGKPEPKETSKPSSLSDLFQVSMRGTTQMADQSATEKEPTSHTEDLRAEKSDDAEHEISKTDEEKDDEEESHEQRKSDLVSEAPVMVDMGDADVKVAHKKSHSILSGVGSKVKHSIAKVKKAIIGKSSHPKPPSPKKVTN